MFPLVRKNVYLFGRNSLLSSRASNTTPFHRRTYSDLPTYLVNTPLPKITTLPSGVRVATSDGISSIATVGVWIGGAGSASDTDQTSGIANFLQNILLRGTFKKSKQELDREIENIGASLMGRTTRESTSFIIQASKEDVPQVFPILSEIVKNTSFKEEHVERARELILKEQTRLRSKFEDCIIDHVHSAAYQGSPYASSVIGEPTTVKKIKVDDLKEFQKKHYIPSNIVIVGAGGVKHEQLLSLASDVFSSIPSSINKPTEIPHPDYVGSEIRIRDDTVHDVKSFFAYEAVGREHPHYLSFMILKKLLSNWSCNGTTGIYQSSRIVETIAIEKLAHEFRTVYIPYKNTGLFGIYSSTTSDKIDDLTYEILNDLQKFSTYTTPHELIRAKNQLKASVLKGFENSLVAASDIGESVLTTSRIQSLLETYERIDAIQMSDIEDVLSNYLTDVDLVVVSHGPNESLPDYNLIRNWTYWNRW